MSEIQTYDSSAVLRRSGTGIRLLACTAYIAAIICLVPMIAVTVSVFTGGTNTIVHLLDTVLLGYAVNTVILVISVAIGTLVLGCSAAWLVTMTRFPGVRILEVALVLPLAFPAYVLAYAYTHVLDHPGIVQSTLRNVTGWGPKDYWFPEIRSLGGAALMLILVLYPYVYLLARAAFLQQTGVAFLVARTLGKTAHTSFWKVSFPMARPAIAGGVLLAVMETIADFGTVAYFGVPTLATGIYTSWFSFADRAAAAQIAVCLFGFALLLVLLERFQRGESKYYDTGGSGGSAPPVELSGVRAVFACVVCGGPVVLGCLLPVVILFEMGIGSEQDLLSRRYIGFIQNSIMLAGIAAVLTVTMGIAVGYFQYVRPSRSAQFAFYVSRLGYAVPGGVIAVGLMVPFAIFDNSLDAWMKENFNLSTGLLFTGSIWLLVGAYMVRFMAVAIGAYEGGQSTVHTNMDAASRTLGKTPMATLRWVHLPILTPSLLTALLIVFVDVMKELPATLIMRPFNFDTLAVQAYRLASDERLEGAAVPSLVIVSIGLVPVILLCRQISRRLDLSGA